MNNNKRILSPFLMSAVLMAFGLGGPGAAWPDAPVSEENHREFEKKFTEMCIENEKAAMKGTGVLLAEVISVCECIAREESKRVMSEEIREFVIEGKYPASLMMKSNVATYVCLQHQEKTKP